MELRDILLTLRKSWVLLLSVVLIVVGSTAAWTLTRTPQYRTSTQLFVSMRVGEGSVGDLSQGSSYVRQAVSSYVSVVTSSMVMDQVISDLDLNISTSDVKKKVKANSPENTVLINISVTDSDPERAAAIANTTATVFTDVISNQLEKTAENEPVRVQVDVIEPAQIPVSAVSPRTGMNLALGFLAGITLGVALVLVRSVLDTRVRSKADIEAISELPIVGMIGRDPESEKRPLVALKDPRNPLVESFRTLRTNLSYLNVEDDSNSVIITSAGPNEGKTTTAMNLAVVMADSGARVVLVDADLRKPSIAKTLGIEGGVGLSDLLAGKASFEDVLQQFGRQHLFVLPAGRIPPNPSELLGSKTMGKVLDMLSEHFDYVIIDTPPVLAVTDAAILSKRAGGTLMIAAAGRVRKQELSNALEALETVGGNLLGVVVTMVPTKGPDAYSYSSYSYQYYGSPTPIVSIQEERALNVDLGSIKS